MDCSLPSSSIHGILQARILEWVAISFSRGSSRPRDWTQVSCIIGRCFTVWATREVPMQPPNYHFSSLSCERGWGWRETNDGNVIKNIDFGVKWYGFLKGLVGLHRTIQLQLLGSQETPGVTDKFGLGIQNEAGQRLIESCQENDWS